MDGPLGCVPPPPQIYGRRKGSAITFKRPTFPYIWNGKGIHFSTTFNSTWFGCYYPSYLFLTYISLPLMVLHSCIINLVLTNVWCIKNHTRLSNVLLLYLVRFLLHQTILTNLKRAYLLIRFYVLGTTSTMLMNCEVGISNFISSKNNILRSIQEVSVNVVPQTSGP